MVLTDLLIPESHSTLLIYNVNVLDGVLFNLCIFYWFCETEEKIWNNTYFIANMVHLVVKGADKWSEDYKKNSYL